MIPVFAQFCRALGRLAALGWIMITAAVAFASKRAHRRDLLGRAHWLQITCSRGLRALAITSHSRGPCPRGQIVAVNHLGYVDILVLAAAAPTVFVAKREVSTWPLFGWFARVTGTRFINREKRADVARVANELAPALAAGVNVVLFLEGTSTAGEGVLPFKSSLLDPAARNAWTIAPAALAYRVPIGYSAAHNVCWWGDMTLPTHLWNLAGVPWIAAQLAWGALLPPQQDRKELARSAHAAVVALHASSKESSAEFRAAATVTLVEQVV